MIRLTLAVLAAAFASSGQQPKLSNAQFESAPLQGDVEASVRSAAARHKGPVWVGYAVKARPGMGQSCCWNNGHNCGCGLEGGKRGGGMEVSGSAASLEGSGFLAVLARVENGSVGRLRAYSMDCPLDAGGLPVAWMTGVSAGQSIAFLHQYRKLDGALPAVAMQDGAEADAELERLAGNSEPLEMRRNAVFWLGNSRGRRGYEIVSRIAREDPDDKLREHAVFALTQSKEPEAVTTIIRMAKEDRSAHVRGQALFWMAQMASQKAEAVIGESIERDPDTEVKRQAVFALTQLPDGRGVPKLIEVAKNNRNHEVRKQAMFWLGQSEDKRALEFLEGVLTR